MIMVRTWSDAKAVTAIITSINADTKDQGCDQHPLCSASEIFLLQFPLRSFIRSESPVGSISRRSAT
jgi:hypothetical protein